ncbi:hypothetical protein PFLmoz3_01973 [Pseudomonas fluorescens]|uniref:Uncharacterized protein n=1 Tax=Pseudomonas fluorescens TaxID=294 RepID=A0A109LKE4_PSEFL|nr:hypothetical protein PFLmoz3_01973 [Pseudomonas fluorescens]
MPGVDNHTLLPQTLEPGAQKWRGFHIGRKYATGGADKGLDTQAMDPFAQRLGAKAAQQRRHVRGAFGVARQERRVRLGVGDVHAAHACQQELAPHRRHAVVQVHAHASLAQDFGGHQPGGAAADNGDVVGRSLRHGQGYGDVNRPSILPDHDAAA